MQMDFRGKHCPKSICIADGFSLPVLCPINKKIVYYNEYFKKELQ